MVSEKVALDSNIVIEILNGKASITALLSPYQKILIDLSRPAAAPCR